MVDLNSPILAVVIIYVVFASLFFVFSDAVLFPAPSPPTYRDTAQIIKIPLENGEHISAIHLPNETAKYTLLFSHGNAEDLGTLSPWLELYRQQGFAVFAYDYRGYGTSSKKASEQNSYEDIRAAYSYLTRFLSIDPSSIVLLGRSLGAGPSLELATQVPVRAVILESPFVSAYRVKTYIPLFPFDKFRNLAKIRKVAAPLLVIHGEKDSVIPIWHGKKLFEAATTRFKESHWVKEANHNDILMVDQEQYWRALREFLQNSEALLG